MPEIQNDFLYAILTDIGDIDWRRFPSLFSLGAFGALYRHESLGQALIERDFAQGPFVSLAEAESDEIGYYIITSRNGASANARTFIRWLKAQA